ncbi:hypothetical protein SAMN05443633_101465 [Chryseobacterium arachidis]|uniref:Uncharacterized protein n=1 Tax=Chryseobacterium arachidis TaxID=1416778 RepID=A0A1M4UCJ4_9FLAO|nr:hypothetical protein [Chryseobacterium arachidis]SHE54394.1 hypothetical protein SAMN05443633_101465 [Chryseobacterium arachidis]
MNVLEKYKLIFVNRPYSYPNEQAYLVKDAIHYVENDFLGYFLTKFKIINDIDEIVKDIDFILSEGFYDREYCLEIYLDFLDVIYTDTTALFQETTGILIEEIPLDDLKNILLHWKRFIQTEPLEKTKVEKNSDLIYFLKENEKEDEIAKFIAQIYGSNFTLIKS